MYGYIRHPVLFTELQIIQYIWSIGYMEGRLEERMGEFKNQIMRTLYVMPMRLDSAECKRKIFNNFKSDINIIRMQYFKMTNMMDIQCGEWVRQENVGARELGDNCNCWGRR